MSRSLNMTAHFRRWGAPREHAAPREGREQGADAAFAAHHFSASLASAVGGTCSRYAAERSCHDAASHAAEMFLHMSVRYHRGALGRHDYRVMLGRSSTAKYTTGGPPCHKHDKTKWAALRRAIRLADTMPSRALVVADEMYIRRFSAPRCCFIFHAEINQASPNTAYAYVLLMPSS